MKATDLLTLSPPGGHLLLVMMSLTVIELSSGTQLHFIYHDSDSQSCCEARGCLAENLSKRCMLICIGQLQMQLSLSAYLLPS